MNTRRFVITVILGLLGLVVALLGLSTGFPSGVHAANISARLAEIPVCSIESPDCDDGVNQDATDAASAGDLIRVSAGSCTNINNSGGLSQRVVAMGWISMTSGTKERLNGVWGSSGSDVFAVGENYASTSGIILHYDGMAWSPMISGTTDSLYSVWGSSGSDVFAVGYEGTILHYDGTDWSPMNSGTTDSLRGVWGSSGSDVFAVGYPGTILHYDGTAWSPMSSGTTSSLLDVWGSSGSDVFAVSVLAMFNGEILHYDGTAWNVMSNANSPLRGVWGSSDSDVFAVGGVDLSSGTILHYDGTAWNVMSSVDHSLSGAWGSSGSDVFAVGRDGTILHYDGNAWSPMNSGTTKYLIGVWGSSGSDVFAVGGGGTILHYSGPDLALAKAVQPGTTVSAGELITFTLAFSYAGSVTATGVVITDVVPIEVTQVAYTSSFPVTPTGTVSYTWLLGDLPPDGGGVITITGVVSPGLPPGYVFTNTATITSAMVDASPANNQDWVRLSVQAAPVAVEDAYTTTEDMPLAVAAPGVLGNDYDLNDDPLTALLDSPPLSGMLALSPNGSFTYTPTLNFNGVDTFTYHATDTISDSNVAAVTLTVTTVNDPPLALDDDYVTPEDMPLIVVAPGVLGNDGDVDGDTLAAVLDSPPLSGTLALSPDGSFTYTPTLDFHGVDTFTYHATDTISDSNLAAVTLTVIAVNDPPLAVDDRYTTTEDMPLIVPAPGVLANDGDVDGDTLAAVLDSQPLSGTLVLNPDASFTYTPTTGFVGTDSFTYYANDGTADSNLATVILAVEAQPVHYIYLPLVIKQ